MISRPAKLRRLAVLWLILALLLGTLPLPGVLAEELDDPTVGPSEIAGQSTGLASLLGFGAAPLLEPALTATADSTAQVESFTAGSATIEICSFSSARARSPFENAIGNRGYETLRASLLDPAKFGPSGTVASAVTIRAGVDALTAANLAGCGVFFTSVFSGPLSGDEATALTTAVKGGMVLIADGDTTTDSQVAVNSVLAALGGGSVGAATVCSNDKLGGTIATAYSEISTGPFGNVGGQSFGTSRSTNVNKLARDTSVASCAGTEVRYVIPRHALGQGSGPVMIGGDPSGYDLFTSPTDLLYNANNLTLYLNAIAAAAGEQPDTEAPTITAPADITTNTDPGKATATVTYPAPTATDNRPGATASCVPVSGSAFPVGTTTVTCTATDAAGNTATDTFTVTVIDNSPPTLTVPANIIAVNGPPVNGVAATGATVTYPPPTVTDNAPGATASCAPPPGSSFPFGVTTVTCHATDAVGNTASASFTVTVCEAHFRNPLDEGVDNTVRSDRTIPVRITVVCQGAPKTGLAPSIKLLAGDVSPTSEAGSAPVETTEPAWAANTNGIMKEDNSGYYYKLHVPSTAAVGQKLTVRVRPFGESNTYATMYAVLKIVK